MATVNEALRDRAIKHAIALLRYGAGLSDKIVRLLNSADKDILDKVAAGLAAIEERGIAMSPASLKRLNKLLEEVRALNGAIYAQLHDVLATELADFGAGEAEFQRKALVAAIGADLGTKLPAPALLRAIVEEAPLEGRLLSAWTEGMAEGRIDRIGQAVRLGMVQGKGTDAIVRRIRGSKASAFSDGVLQISRRSAQSIVRTSINHVSNVAAQHTWRANDHVVKAWQFLGTLDSRTTISCAALNGQSFPIGEGPIPPRHIRCRSISIAVTKSFRELGLDYDELPPSKRAGMDGQVAGDTTFAQWLRDKGTATQEEVLGKTRAELFRSGKLKLEDFITGDGTVLTLQQLKGRYPYILL
jgi:SPP1 gp7 family putative phage head morphogenesis protein